MLTCQSHLKVWREGRYLHILQPPQPHCIRLPHFGEILHWNSEENQHNEEIRHDGGNRRTEVVKNVTKGFVKAFKESYKSANVKGQVKKSNKVVELAGENPLSAN
jgi:hypothetical protein